MLESTARNVLSNQAEGANPSGCNRNAWRSVVTTGIAPCLVCSSGKHYPHRSQIAARGFLLVRVSNAGRLNRLLQIKHLGPHRKTLNEAVVGKAHAEGGDRPGGHQQRV